MSKPFKKNIDGVEHQWVPITDKIDLHIIGEPDKAKYHYDTDIDNKIFKSFEGALNYVTNYEVGE